MKKILLIDDEEDFCFFIRTNLELTEDYKVIIATNGKKGLRIAQLQKPDLILLDIMMPEMNGFEVLKKLRKKSKTQSIPLIILTAIDGEDSSLQTSGFSVLDYIVKPFKIERLLSKIENAIQPLGNVAIKEGM